MRYISYKNQTHCTTTGKEKPEKTKQKTPAPEDHNHNHNKQTVADAKNLQNQTPIQILSSAQAIVWVPTSFIK